MEIFETSELSKVITFVRRCLWVVFHEANGLQTNKVCSFSLFEVHCFQKYRFCQKISLMRVWIFKFFKAPELSKSQTLSKEVFGLVFHHTVDLQNKQSLSLRNFSGFEKRCILVFFLKRELHKISKCTFSLQKMISICSCNMQA